MKPETPAQGILKRNEWGNTKLYQVVCDCYDSDHDHKFWVEADESTVSVTLYTTTVSAFWSTTRWQQMWQLLIKGYIKQEVSLCMQEQQAINYANTLTSAVNDVKIFRDNTLKDK